LEKRILPLCGRYSYVERAYYKSAFLGKRMYRNIWQFTNITNSRRVPLYPSHGKFVLIFSAQHVCVGVIPVCEGKLKLTSIAGVI